MFTGLIESIATVTDIKEESDHDTRCRVFRFKVAHAIRKGMKIGDSICINGVCHTVTKKSGLLSALRIHESWFEVRSHAVTLEKTTFSQLQRNARVNIERSLQLKDRMGGHIVQGHVDYVARITNIIHDAHNLFIYVTLPLEAIKYIVKEGSITVDGISLTIADIQDTVIKLNIITHTLAHTTLSNKTTNDLVNIEVDTLLKYAHRVLTTKNMD